MVNIYHITSKKDIEKFNKQYKSNQVYIILVFAEWCPHCKTLMPIWYNAIESIHKNTHINFIIIEQSYLNLITKNYDILYNIIKNVIAFPTIIAFKNKDKKNIYDKPMNEENLKTFFKNKGELS